MAFQVLVVDDSDIMRSIIRKILTVSGIDIGTIYEAGNGAEALAVMEKNWVDVVLTDINMPTMNGVEMIQKMKTMDGFADVPVIVVSTEGRDNRIEEIMHAGAVGYITKPFRPEEVAAIVYQALGVNPDERYIEEPEDSDF